MGGVTGLSGVSDTSLYDDDGSVFFLYSTFRSLIHTQGGTNGDDWFGIYNNKFKQSFIAPLLPLLFFCCALCVSLVLCTLSSLNCCCLTLSTAMCRCCAQQRVENLCSHTLLWVLSNLKRCLPASVQRGKIIFIFISPKAI